MTLVIGWWLVPVLVTLAWFVKYKFFKKESCTSWYDVGAGFETLVLLIPVLATWVVYLSFLAFF